MIYTVTLNPALDREMTVPEMAFDRVLRASSIRTDYGGKGFNVSRALLALGTDSIVLGFIGGAIGAQLADGLIKLGISTDFLSIQGETRINLSVVGEDHEHYFKVNEAGPRVTPEDCKSLLNKVSSIVSPGDWWVLAGSSPPGIQPPFIADLVDCIQASGAYALVDMEGIWLKAACTSKVFMVKPNAIEAGELIGSIITNIDDAIGVLPKIHEIGAQRVVITLGKTGAVYSDGHSTWWAIPPSIKERNPIGAGDAMLGGLVWALHKNLKGGQVLRWGIACGAAAASLDGTAMGSIEMVESLASRVQVWSTSNDN